MSNRLLLVIIGLLVANLVVGIVKSPTDTASVTDDGSIGLVRPWFIDEALASDDRSARAIASIADEAGISAYVKTPTTINLTTVRGAFTSVIESNANYLLGTIIPTGYTGDFSTHILVHKSGWIMAWYHKDQVASTIIHENDLTFANKTKLSITIDKLTTTLKLRNINPTYYHFKYPSANRLLIARKKPSCSTHHLALDPKCSYTYKPGISAYQMKISIPTEITAFETSAFIGWGRTCSASLWINTSLVDRLCNVGYLDHYVDVSAFMINRVNVIEYNDTQVAIVIIYQG